MKKTPLIAVNLGKISGTISRIGLQFHHYSRKLNDSAIRYDRVVARALWLNCPAWAN